MQILAEANHGHLAAILLQEHSRQLIEIKLESFDLLGTDQGLSKEVRQVVVHPRSLHTEALQLAIGHQEFSKLFKDAHCVALQLAQVQILQVWQGLDTTQHLGH